MYSILIHEVYCICLFMLSIPLLGKYTRSNTTFLYYRHHVAANGQNVHVQNPIDVQNEFQHGNELNQIQQGNELNNVGEQDQLVEDGNISENGLSDLDSTTD